MDDKARCQSCGMPLGEGFYGTEADGLPSSEYCKFCYQNGSFVDSTMTVEKMIALSIDNMVNDLKMSEEQAEKLANEFVPKLGRWKHESLSGDLPGSG